MSKLTNTSFQTKKIERTSYWLYFLGLNIFYGLVTVNMQTFYSDVGISATAIAMIVLLTKIWDAVNDIMFGGIIDRSRFKKGRYIPWLRISTPILCISGILFFALPKTIAYGPKVVWATVAYVAFSMAYTISDVPMFILPTTMTSNIAERGNLLTIGRYFAMIGVTGICIIIPMLQKRAGWFVCGLVVSLIAGFCNCFILFKGKERNIVRTQNSATAKQMFRYISGNKYLLIFSLALCVQGLTNFGSYVSLYFARYNLGNQDLASVITILSFIPTLLVGAFVPKLTQRMDKFVLYIICQIICVIMGFVRYFVGYTNLTVFMVLTFIAAVFSSITYIIMYTFTLDILEYGTYHTGERAEGVAAAIQTFISKFTGSVSSALVMLILAALGFVSGDVEVQSATVLNGFWMLTTCLPAVGTLLSVILLCFYKLRDKDVQVMTQYNNGMISREEAEEKLANKYGAAAALENLTIDKL